MKKISALVIVIITIMILSMQVFALEPETTYTSQYTYWYMQTKSDGTREIFYSNSKLYIGSDGKVWRNAYTIMRYASSGASNWNDQLTFDGSGNTYEPVSGSTNRRSNYNVLNYDGSTFLIATDLAPTPTPTPSPTPTPEPTTTATTTVSTETTIITAEENEIQQTNYLKSIYIILAFALVLTAGGLVIYFTLKPIYLFLK